MYKICFKVLVVSNLCLAYDESMSVRPCEGHKVKTSNLCQSLGGIHLDWAYNENTSARLYQGHSKKMLICLQDHIKGMAKKYWICIKVLGVSNIGWACNENMSAKPYQGHGNKIPDLRQSLRGIQVMLSIWWNYVCKTLTRAWWKDFRFASKSLGYPFRLSLWWKYICKTISRAWQKDILFVSKS